jgi:hypothetical protein
MWKKYLSARIAVVSCQDVMTEYAAQIAVAISRKWRRSQRKFLPR